MGKFKAGDNVVLEDGSHLMLQDNSENCHWPLKAGDYFRYWKVDGTPYKSGTRILSLEQLSPIRTVTRREIVPGCYGIVEVDESSSEEFANIQVDMLAASATELREAARIFSEIADVLDENAATTEQAA